MAGSRALTILLVIGAVLLAILPNAVWAEAGFASWYELRSRTASGEFCDPEAMTAAHRSLAFGTWVKVENLENHRWTVVRINDRGPFVEGRIVDLTRRAARRLGIVGTGITSVLLTVLPSHR